MSETKYIYFKAKTELLEFFADMGVRASEFSDKAKELAESVGGEAAVISRGSMVGVHFPKGAPKGWKNLEGSSKWDGFFRPLVSKSIELREFAKKMGDLRKPTWREVQEKLKLNGHIVMGTPAFGQRGIPMLSAEGEEIGADLIIKVPTDGNLSYAGHEWLTSISEADYLQMKADAARAQEAA